MKSLAAQIVQVDEEIVECNADLLRIQGALTQVNDMAESVGELQVCIRGCGLGAVLFVPPLSLCHLHYYV
jgi:hypothetical protein